MSTPTFSRGISQKTGFFFQKKGEANQETSGRSIEKTRKKFYCKRSLKIAGAMKTVTQV